MQNEKIEEKKTIEEVDRRKHVQETQLCAVSGIWQWVLPLLNGKYTGEERGKRVQSRESRVESVLVSF